LTRDALGALIEASLDATVVKAQSADEALRRHRGVDLVITDVDLPGTDTSDVVSQLVQHFDCARVLVLAQSDDTEIVKRALGAGASGYALKTADVDTFLTAIRDVAAGRAYLQPQLGAALATQDTNGAASSFELTNTEVRLLTLLARGYTNAEIARSEHVSLRTIEGRRANLKIKLGCHGRAALTRHALELGLLSTA
jgi:DNA-binding NarL/FixJ family response regulator